MAVTHDLPGVGENLHDHVDVFLIYDLTGPHSYDKYKKLRWQAAAALQYALFRNGPLTSNIAEGGLCWYGPDKSDPLPNLQYRLLLWRRRRGRHRRDAETGNGCTLNIGQMRPRSARMRSARSGDPNTPPLLTPATSLSSTTLIA